MTISTLTCHKIGCFNWIDKHFLVFNVYSNTEAPLMWVKSRLKDSAACWEKYSLRTCKHIAECSSRCETDQTWNCCLFVGLCVCHHISSFCLPTDQTTLSASLCLSYLSTTVCFPTGKIRGSCHCHFAHKPCVFRLSEFGCGVVLFTGLYFYQELVTMVRAFFAPVQATCCGSGVNALVTWKSPGLLHSGWKRLPLFVWKTSCILKLWLFIRGRNLTI